MSAENSLDGLRKAYASTETQQPSLNTIFRGALKDFAVAQSLQFSEDSAGNNYITRRGKDPSIAPIAITFPLDGSLSETSFTSAFRVFSLLAKVELPCDLLLVGWTSLGERIVGRDIWDSSVTASSQVIPSELASFQQGDDPKDVSVSAVVEVSEQMGAPLRIEGSPVLVKKARRLMTALADVRELGKGLARAPCISITGPEAESIACSIIREYSAYIVALFDNFD
ncbi:uncharacterized protein GGS22DRAFT_189711 [Annulohypoxylon maeteangense]|uniref:uncharacterized protein n=1 Tax=Annulohypoxylon maeteangense TaxID=1927788 RepID=UPI002008BDFE|nr:uncharacterized protein GGS22DRAFT_189711 [Annulohypoxylon maeteangense]KAI0883744.1 hypothetical protein GGS22DRAFT_189711 [Annulohypoxylon maeteangense]